MTIKLLNITGMALKNIKSNLAKCVVAELVKAQKLKDISLSLPLVF